MKYFKQTKETKRKISFFMVLALVISLLPVQPVAAASRTDKEKVAVYVTNNCKELVTTSDITTEGVIRESDNASGAAFTINASGNNSIISAVASGTSITVPETGVATLGSIKVKTSNDTVETVVVTASKTETGEMDSSIASSGAITPSSVEGNNGIATVEMEEKVAGNSTSAAITVVGLSDNVMITISKVTEDEKPAKPETCDVSFGNTLDNVSFKVSYTSYDEEAGKEVPKETDIKDASSKITVVSGSSITFTVEAAEGYTFKEAPKINDVVLVLDESTGKYTGVIEVKEDLTITISGVAEKDETPKPETCDVSLKNSLENASLKVSYTSYNEAGEEVTEEADVKDITSKITVISGSSITLSVTADSAYAFVKSQPSAEVNGETKEFADGGITFEVKEDTEIVVSGAADKVSNVKVNKLALAGVKCQVTYNNEDFAEGTVVSGDAISIVIEPEEGYVLSLPEVKVNGVLQNITGPVSGNSYTYNIIITDADETVIDISANAQKQYNVTYKNGLKNADVKVLFNGEEFTNVKLTENDKVVVKITPNKGFFYDNTDIGKIITAIGATSITETLENNVYTAIITGFTGDTEINISGEPEERTVINITDTESNIGNADLNISKEDLEKKQPELIAAFGEKAQVVADAVSNGGVVALKLEVATSGAVSADDMEAITNSEDGSLSSLTSDDIGKGVNLDIKLIAICHSADGEVIASEKVNSMVKITISLTGEAFKDIPKNKVKEYYVIRIHEGEAKKLPCKDEGNDCISFESDLFSTYILMYEENTSTETPAPGGNETPEPGNSSEPGSSSKPGNNNGGGIGSYIPTTTSTPAPGTSATPAPSSSAAPSTEPGATPGTGTEKPGTAVTPEPGTGTEEPGTPGTNPTKTPAGTSTPKPDNNTTNIKVGKKVTVNSSKYKVTSVKGTRTVQFTSGKKSAKTVIIPATIKVSGKNYKVTSIAKDAFKNNKKLKKLTIGKNIKTIGKNAFRGCSNLKNIIIKTNKLTAKKTGANAFKGINKKAVIKVPAKKVKAYKKIVKAKGAGKNVKTRK